MIGRLWHEATYRLRTLFRRGDVERELDAELAFHIERETAKLVDQGLPHAEAERRARAAFGGVQGIKDDTRDAHGIALFEHAAQDLRYALRSLMARKTFTVGVTLTLALGLGANATMFGIVDRLMFRAPPFLDRPASVFRLYRHTLDGAEPRVDRNLAFRTYLDLSGSLRSFSQLAAFQTLRLAVGDGEAVREVPVTVASASYFDFFDVRPAAGRFFTAADDVLPQGTPVVVLGYAYWQSAYTGQDVVGRQIRVGAVLNTIIGVAPPGFVGMSDQGVPALYMPITAYAFSVRGAAYPEWYGWSWMEIIGRKQPGVTVAAAQLDLQNGFFRSWQNAYATNAQWGRPEEQHIAAELGPIQINRGPQAGRDAQVATWVGGVALIVLLIACANVANLLLSRAVSRRREIAVRLALGVSRWRLTGQLLIESVLLALLGSAAGLTLAQWGAAGLRRWFIPEELDAGPLTDGRTLLFAAVATLAVVLLTGLVPAIRAGRADVSGELKAGARGTPEQHAHLRAGLLVAQVALSMVLLVGAGLFVRSLTRANAYRLGYDVDHTLFVVMRDRGVQLKPEERLALNARLEDAARSVPGVAFVTQAQTIPFQANDQRQLRAPGVDSVNSRGRFLLQSGTADYFAVTGTRILRGRAFGAADRAGTMPVVVVSEGMARAIWGDQDPLGKCLQFAAQANPPCMTVIGVAEEAHMRSFADPREYAYYVPALQLPQPLDPNLLVRVAGASPDVAASLRRRLQAEMPGAAYVTVTPVRQLVAPRLRSWQLGATMFTAFGGLALLLAAVGLYSLMAYEVAQRKRELSVRIALGATMGRVVRFVVGRGTRLVTAGLVLGGTVAVWAAPSLGPQLFQEPPRDPGVFAAVTLTLFAVGCCATAVPAWLASHVDPNVALREE